MFHDIKLIQPHGVSTAFGAEQEPHLPRSSSQETTEGRANLGGQRTVPYLTIALSETGCRPGWRLLLRELL